MPRRYRPPMTGRQRAKVACFFLSAALIALFSVGTVHLKAILSSLAVTQVTNRVGQVVNDAVVQAIDSGRIRYNQLITFEKSSDGRITALESNMAEFNRLQSAIAEDVLSRLGEVSNTELEIPLGTLTGSALLAGRGPSFTVRMQSVSSCSAHFSNSFGHAGINQTTHSILLHVDVSVSILLPGFRTSTQVSNAFSVAETVIVGEVPDSYTYFSSSDSIEDSAHEYAINNG